MKAKTKLQKVTEERDHYKTLYENRRQDYKMLESLPRIGAESHIGSSTRSRDTSLPRIGAESLIDGDPLVRQGRFPA